MSQRPEAQPASAARVQTAGRAREPHGAQWWRVSWSAAAALRAVRATIVIPCLFALTFKVIGDAQMTLFAVFGGFATLVVTTFAGTRSDKALAHLGLAVAGSIVIVIGTLASGQAWLAAVVTVPVAFAVYLSGSAGQNAAAGVTACLFAFVLPIASAGTASVLPSRLEGWWLASAASTIAVLLLSARPAGNRLRAQAASVAAALADQLDVILATGNPQTGNGGAPNSAVGSAQREALLTAKQAMLDTFVASPYRPIGLVNADVGLANVVHLLEWCTSLVCDASDLDLDSPGITTPDRELIEASAATMHQMAEVLAGRQLVLNLAPVWHARHASARNLRTVSSGLADAVRQADYAFHAQAIGIATTAAAAETLIAARLATPAAVEALRRDWLARMPGTEPQSGADRRAAQTAARPATWTTTWTATWTAEQPVRRLSMLSADASLRSVWFRNSARGAIALAAAVAVARLTDVQHAFWVVLGTLSVLRTNATATGATALRALAGTVAGFAVGAALLVGIGVSPVALWIAFPLAVLVAAYTPGTAPFVAGQAAFTVTIVVLFNLLVPAGWKVGLLRVEDVAIGCAVSLVVGLLFWPRGASSVVGDNLAVAFRSGSGYLGDAVSWALGDRQHRPERAAAAIAAGNRLDDAVRGYLTEQGSKRLTKTDLWTLVMATLRLRLTAHSMASLPGRAAPHGGDTALHAALGRQSAGLSAWYEQLAGLLARPAGGTPEPVLPPPPASGIATVFPQADGEPQPGGSPAYQPDALWVGQHLDHLGMHLTDVAGPAARLAQLRRRPWWR
jgi:Fusaric acid resistance protein-like